MISKNLKTLSDLTTEIKRSFLLLVGNSPNPQDEAHSEMPNNSLVTSFQILCPHNPFLLALTRKVTSPIADRLTLVRIFLLIWEMIHGNRLKTDW